MRVVMKLMLSTTTTTMLVTMKKKDRRFEILFSPPSNSTRTLFFLFYSFLSFSREKNSKMRLLEFTPDFCHRRRKCGSHHRGNLNPKEISANDEGRWGPVSKGHGAARHGGVVACWSVVRWLPLSLIQGQREAWRRGIPQSQMFEKSKRRRAFACGVWWWMVQDVMVVD